MAASQIDCRHCPKFPCEEDSVLLGYNGLLLTGRQVKSNPTKGNQLYSAGRNGYVLLLIVLQQDSMDSSKGHEFEPNKSEDMTALD